MNEKICVIGIYFGNIPNWFSLWLRSAEYNTTIDFLLFMDSEIDRLPKNVRIVKSSLKEIEMLAKSKLNMDVNLSRPYKLCDFKPVWGVILQDYIVGYDYWGHCDFDLLFGDIRSFVEKYKLSQYDKFLTLGHFSLYRNSRSCYDYYKLPGSSINYKEAFTKQESCYFDEFNNINGIYKTNGIPLFSDESVFINVNPWLNRIQRFDYVNYRDQVFFWQKGKVFRSAVNDKGNLIQDEYIYIHICKRNINDLVTDAKSVEAIWISKNSFIAKDPNHSVTLMDIETYNCYCWYIEWKECIIRYIKRFQILIRDKAKHYLMSSRIGNKLYLLYKKKGNNL